MSSIPTIVADFSLAESHDSIIILRSSKVQGLLDSQPFLAEPMAIVIGSSCASANALLIRYS